MGITAEWINDEKTILHQFYAGEWTWDDYEASIRERTAMLDSVDHKVDVITDVSEMIVPKDALANLSKITASSAFTHPNMGLLVIVGASRFVQIMSNIAVKFGGIKAGKIVVVPTLEEAYEVVKEQQLRRYG